MSIQQEPKNVWSYFAQYALINVAFLLVAAVVIGALSFVLSQWAIALLIVLTLVAAVLWGGRQNPEKRRKMTENIRFRDQD